MADVRISKLKTGTCFICGASDGLHKYETMECPMYGREETREGVPQRWEDTRFDDSGEHNLHRGAIGLACALDSLAARLMAAPAAKRGSQRREADMLAFHEAKKSMELSGVAAQCPSYANLKKLGGKRA